METNNPKILDASRHSAWSITYVFNEILQHIANSVVGIYAKMLDCFPLRLTYSLHYS